MKQIKHLFLLCPLAVLLCLTCCVTNSNQPGENEKTEIAEDISEKSFDLFDFVSELANSMEVVDVFSAPNIEYLVMLLGKEVLGRHYFEYRSPFYLKPISSADEMFAMFSHQATIAKQTNPNAQWGITIHDYRREGLLRYTIKETDGSFRYGMYIIASAVINEIKEELIYEE